MAARDVYPQSRLRNRSASQDFTDRFHFSPPDQRIIIVSNRLPLVLRRDGDGWDAKPAAGGLVAAMHPILRKRGGVWVGWSGAADTDAAELSALFERRAEEDGFRMQAVSLSGDEIDGFYRGFSNGVIWPLFHDMPTPCDFNPDYWHDYCRVNRKFAEVLAKEATADDFLWVHDYHLMRLGRELSRLKVPSRRGFFLHIPFPSLDLFLKLPWRQQLLDGLLGFDLIAFQTERDRRNFLQCAAAMTERFQSDGGGRESVHARFLEQTAAGGKTWRNIEVATLPISIDYAKEVKDVVSQPVQQRMRQLRSELQGQRMILGVDRLDYTKGILHRLRAFRLALERHADLRGRITLVQHVVPSREDIGEYARLRRDVEQLVSEINGEFSELGWVPIHYMYHSLSWEDLLAYYAAADIALITPLKDGMNLVAKEYCAAKVDDEGVLILSEFAGAAEELRCGALLVNPHDIGRTAESIYQAFVMPWEERIERMHSMRRIISNQDVFHWAESFLTAATLREAPELEGIKLDSISPRAITAQVG